MDRERDRHDIVSAGESFCRETIKQLRDERCGVEDGRMVYAEKRDAPLLDVVRSGFPRRRRAG